MLAGLTPIGRTTIRVLAMNAPVMVAAQRRSSRKGVSPRDDLAGGAVSWIIAMAWAAFGAGGPPCPSRLLSAAISPAGISLFSTATSDSP